MFSVPEIPILSIVFVTTCLLSSPSATIPLTFDMTRLDSRVTLSATPSSSPLSTLASTPTHTPPPLKCLTLDERESLVESCRKKARELKLYEHVARCFGHELDRLAAQAGVTKDSSSMMCIEERQIIDVLINCAVRFDPGDLPARDSLWDGTSAHALKPAVRTATITVGLTGLSFGGSVKMSLKRVKPMISTERDLQSAAKWNMCDRNFICCLFQHADVPYTSSCLAERCIESTGCK